MFYGVEVCPLNKSQTESLQFADGSFVKIFDAKSKSTPLLLVNI